MTAPLPRLTRDAPARPTTDLVDGWLRVFISLLRLPPSQADSIREELEGHLRDRTRDLMLTGLDEPAATRHAIAELGEATDVAARYRALKTEPRRRLLMHLTLFGTGAAVAMSLIAVTWSGRAGQPAPSPAPQAQPDHLTVEAILRAKSANPTPDLVPELLARAQQSIADREHENRALLGAVLAARGFAFQPAPDDGDLAAIKIDAKFQDARLKDIFEHLAKAADRPLQVEWQVLEASGVAVGTPITVRYSDIPLPRLLTVVSERLGLAGPQGLEARLADGSLVIANREYFDRRELTMAIYDLSSIIAARQETYNEERAAIVPEIVRAVTEFVSPDDWRENGGDLAHLQVVGDRLFVKAPARMHPQIAWILRQLPPNDRAKEGAEPQGAADPADPIIRVYALKHAAADEALTELRSLHAIRKVDFTGFVADARTNSILGKAPADHHAMVAAALDTIDTAARVLERRTTETARQQLAMEQNFLRGLEQTRTAVQAELDEGVKRLGPDHRQSAELKSRLEALDQQINQHRARCAVIEQSVRPRADPKERNPGAQFHLYRLQHAAATEVASALRSLYPGWSINADAHTNSVLVAGAPDPSSAAAAVAQLDVSGSGVK